MRISITELKSCVEAGYAALKDCRLCPRNCGVNRLKGEEGFCHTGKIARVASHNVHTGEEPPISGSRGSGTIFFGSCNLRCKFCQNYPISQLGAGAPATPHEIAKMMLGLRALGCHNINIVTGSHVVPQFLAGLYIAKKHPPHPDPLPLGERGLSPSPPRGEGRGEGGLNIPIIWNSSGYDGLTALKLLDGVVDVYMPDIKYSSNDVAEHYSAATNYWDIVRPVIKEMHRQVGDLQITPSPLVGEGRGEGRTDIATCGLLIRHLVLPGGGAGTEKVLEFIANEVSPDTYISLMSQYFPAHKALDHPILKRTITRQEYQKAVDILHRLGLENGWTQPY